MVPQALATGEANRFTRTLLCTGYYLQLDKTRQYHNHGLGDYRSTNEQIAVSYQATCKAERINKLR